MNRVFQVAIAVTALGLAAVTVSPAQASSAKPLKGADILRDVNVPGLEQFALLGELASPATGALAGTIGSVSSIPDNGLIGGGAVRQAMAPLLDGRNAAYDGQLSFFGDSAAKATESAIRGADLRQVQGLTDFLPADAPAGVTGNPLDLLGGLLGGGGGPLDGLLGGGGKGAEAPSDEKTDAQGDADAQDPAQTRGSADMQDEQAAAGDQGMMSDAAGRVGGALGGLTQTVQTPGLDSNPGAAGLVGVNDVARLSQVAGFRELVGAARGLSVGNGRSELAPLVGDLAPTEAGRPAIHSLADLVSTASIDEIAPLVESTVRATKAGTLDNAHAFNESLQSVTESGMALTEALAG